MALISLESLTPFPCRVLTCEEVLFQGQVGALCLPGHDGEFMVYYQHAPLLQALKPGLCTLISPQHNKTFFFIFGGVCSVEAQETVVFVSHGSPLHGATEDSLAATLKHFQDQMTTA